MFPKGRRKWSASAELTGGALLALMSLALFVSSISMAADAAAPAPAPAPVPASAPAPAPAPAAPIPAPPIPAAPIPASATVPAIKHDHRLRYIQFYQLDNTCKLRRFQLKNGERFNERIVAANFYNEQGAPAAECARHRNGFVVQYEGKYVITMSHRYGNIVKLWRSEFKYNGNQENATSMPIDEDVVSTVITELRGKMALSSCFMDLEVFIVCPIQLEGGRWEFKRILIDKFPESEFLDADQILSIDSKALMVRLTFDNVVRMQADPNTQDIYIAYGVVGNMRDKLAVRNFYDLHNEGRRVQAHFSPLNGFMSVASSGGWTYALTNPAVEYAPGGIQKAIPWNKGYELMRGIRGDTELTTIVGLKKGSSENNETILDLDELLKNVNVEPSTGENGESTEESSQLAVLNDTINLKMFMKSHYPVSGGHSRFTHTIYINKEKCQEYINREKTCAGNLANLNTQTIVAIIVICLITLLFVCIVCFLVMFTIFCVKERKRRRKKKRKTKKKKRVVVSTDPAKEAGVDVELDKEPAAAAAALPGMDDEDEEEKPPEKGFGGYFAQQMRRLTKMDAEDEFEQPDAAGGGGGGRGQESEASTYVLAGEKFEAPPPAAAPAVPAGQATAPIAQVAVAVDGAVVAQANVTVPAPVPAAASTTAPSTHNPATAPGDKK